MKIEDIKKIAILGGGVMGPGIAQTFASGGYDVCMWVRNKEKIEGIKENVRNGLINFFKDTDYNSEFVNDVFKKISFTDSLEKALDNADFILEAIIENKEEKRELFLKIEEMVKKDAVLASNTSALNIFEILPESLLSKSVITHWYSPPQLVPLVEVVKSEKTPEEILNTTVELHKKCGKTPVVMKKFIRGYIANRLQMCLNQEVFYLLDNGYCSPEDIDIAVKTSFVPRAVVLGLCKRADFGGLDMTANNYKNKSYVPPEPVDMPKTLKEHVEKGELGFKTGKGFYDYSNIDKQDLMAKRDKQLMEVYKVAMKFMEDPV